METEPSPFLYNLVLYVQVLSGIDIVWMLVLIAFLLLVSAQISAAEVAYFSLTPPDIQHLQDSYTPAARRVLRLLDHPRYLLATIVIANNFCNISVVLILGGLLGCVIDMAHWDIAYFAVLHIGLAAIIIVLLGELAPKLYGTSNSLSIALNMSNGILLLKKVFFIPSWFLVNCTKFIEKKLREKLHIIHHETISQEDIQEAIDLTIQKDSRYAKQDIELLKSIVQFGHTSVRSVMRPRMEIVAIERTMSFEEIMAIFKETAYSRIPVYEENLDSIVGVLHCKDILPHLKENADFEWFSLIRPAFFVPEHKKIDDLLADFQEKRTHLALVIGEQGGTMGIVTMEDVLEEVVGEIEDEFDEPESVDFTKITDTSYIFDALTPLDKVCDIIQVDIERFEQVRENAETLAGLLLALYGFIPTVDTEIIFEDLRFIVLSATDRRIEQVKIELPNHQNSNYFESI